MIHINYPNGQKPPDDWLAKAKELTNSLMDPGIDKAARDAIIDKHSAFWGEIKEWLERFSHGKCWFSEAKDTCSHWHVEHFRPKKEAKDPDRDGYWWLAFDFLNYRLCGSVVNVKKGAYFPLFPDSMTAIFPEHNCNDEAYILIDPIKKDQVDLITFFAGEAVPSAGDGRDKKRADISIKRYKLNEHAPLKRAREQVWNECVACVNELEELITKRKKAEEMEIHSQTANVEIEQLKCKLERMTAPSTPFSAVARAFLLQDSRPWVRKCIV